MNMRILEEINSDTYNRKSMELRDREATLKAQIEGCDRNRHENGDLAVRAFELSQSLTEEWVKSDYAAKRRILEILCLNFSLDGVTLVPTMRKPFDLMAEGLFSADNRGDWI